MKSNQRPNFNKIPFLSLPQNTQSFLSLQMSHKIARTLMIHRKPPLRKWMEVKLLDGHTNPSKINISHAKLLKQHTSQSKRIMTILKEVTKIFLCPSTKQATKRPNKRRSPPHKPIHSVNPTQQNLLGEEPIFHRNLGPPNHIKNRPPIGGEIQ